MNDFMPRSTQYVAVKFKRNSVRSQRTAMCSYDIFVRSISGASRREHSISSFDYTMILYDAMFDFADMTEKRILC